MTSSIRIAVLAVGFTSACSYERKIPPGNTPCVADGTPIEVTESRSGLDSAASSASSFGDHFELSVRWQGPGFEVDRIDSFVLEMGAVQQVVLYDRPNCNDGSFLVYDRELTAIASMDGALRGSGNVTFGLDPDGITDFVVRAVFDTVDAPWEERSDDGRLEGVFRMQERPDPASSSCMGQVGLAAGRCVWVCDDSEDEACVAATEAGP